MTNPAILAKRMVMLGVISFSLSCDNNPADPGQVVTTVIANSPTIISGTAGAEVGERPSVTVHDQNGDPVAGVTVTFSVTSGAGFITDATPETDADGIATVGGWTLGDVGANTVAASAGNATPVLFSANAVDPCTVLQVFPIQTSWTGNLTTVDCPFASSLTRGTFVDRWTRSLSFNPGRSYTFTETSTEFDTFLLLTTPDGALIAVNDNSSATSTNSAIRALLPTSPVTVLATSAVANATGAYTLSSALTASEITNCDEVWIARGIMTNQSLQTTDCLNSGFLSDDLNIYLAAGQAVTVTMTSSAFDAYLELYRADGTRVAFNDDMSTGTQNAQLTYTATAGGFYGIVPTSGVAGATGAYVLSVR